MSWKYAGIDFCVWEIRRLCDGIDLCEQDISLISIEDVIVH